MATATKEEAAEFDRRGRDSVLIRLEPVTPPIPIRRFDWHAFVDGSEDGDGVYKLNGWGETKQEALRNLANAIEEEE